MQRRSSSSVRIFYPKFNRSQLIQDIRGRMADLDQALPLRLVVLFGSYAKDNYTAASDVDLLVVYGGQEREKAFATVKKTLGIPRLEPHVYSQKEYEAAQETVDKMIEEGVILFRIDGSQEEQLEAIDNAAGAWKDEHHSDMKTDEDIDRWLKNLRDT